MFVVGSAATDSGLVPTEMLTGSGLAAADADDAAAAASPANAHMGGACTGQDHPGAPAGDQ
jgi:hypothetical protein